MVIVQKRPLLCVSAAWAEIWSGGHSVDIADEWMSRSETALAASQVNGTQPYFDGHSLHQIVTSYQAAYRAITLGLRGPPNPSWVDMAREALQIIPTDDRHLRGIVLSQLGIVQLTLGNLPAAQEAFRQAERMSFTGGNTYGALLAVYIQAEIMREHGKLGQAESKLRESIETTTNAQAGYTQPPPIAGAIYIALGDILRESGRMKEAHHWLEAGLQLAKPASMGVIGIGNSQTVEEEGYVIGCVALARLGLVAGDYRALAELDVLAERCSPGLQKYIHLHQARLWLTSPNHEQGWKKAASWAKEQPLEVADPTWDWDYEIPSLLSVVRVRIAEATRKTLPASHPEWEALIGFLDGQAQICRRRGLIERLIEILVLSAMVHKASGKTDMAMDALGQALELASGEGYQRIFLDEGQPMLSLLYQGLESGKSIDAIESLLARSDKQPSTSTTAKPATHPKKLPLTRREIEILELIASGSTNAEICQELSISLGTVKRHTANINLKLDTHNRTQAVARARSMGLPVE
jgi:LuxR family maltose regulon positive regulatory protein